MQAQCECRLYLLRGAATYGAEEDGTERRAADQGADPDDPARNSTLHRELLAGRGVVAAEVNTCGVPSVIVGVAPNTAQGAEARAGGGAGSGGGQGSELCSDDGVGSAGAREVEFCASDVLSFVRVDVDRAQLQLRLGDAAAAVALEQADPSGLDDLVALFGVAGIAASDPYTTCVGAVALEAGSDVCCAAAPKRTRAAAAGGHQDAKAEAAPAPKRPRGPCDDDSAARPLPWNSEVPRGPSRRPQPRAVPVAAFYSAARTSASGRRAAKPKPKPLPRAVDLLWARRRLRELARPRDEFRIFPVQVAAFACCDELWAAREAAGGSGGAGRGGDAADDDAGRQLRTRVFSFETAADGTRRFVVASLRGFWRRYVAVPPAARHFYEIVRERTPCRLYFDIEYLREFNPGADGEQLMRTLRFVVAARLQQCFGVLVDEEDFVDLDSSTAVKFSRHLVVRARPAEALFRDTAHMARWVQAFVSELDAARVEDEAVDALWLRDAHGGRHFFADLAVYTRNRAMRLFLSSKFAKAAVLRLRRPAPGDKRGEDGASGDGSCLPPVDEFEEWKRTLICDAWPVLDGVDGDGPEAEERARWKAWTGHAGLPTKTRLLTYEPQQKRTRSDAATATVPAHARVAGIAYTDPNGAAVSAGAEPSEVPSLDRYVVRVASERGAATAMIRSRSTTYSGAESGQQRRVRRISYFMARNRWCLNIGREHRSNNVVWHADLEALALHQTCLDSSCRGYRSQPVPIPASVLVRSLEALPKVTEEALSRLHAAAPPRVPPPAQSISDDELLLAIANDTSGVWG